MLVTRVKLVDLCLRVTKIARGEAPHAAFQSTLDGQPPNEQTRGRSTPEGTQKSGHRFYKLKDLATVGDHTQ